MKRSKSLFLTVTMFIVAALTSVCEAKSPSLVGNWRAKKGNVVITLKKDGTHVIYDHISPDNKTCRKMNVGRWNYNNKKLTITDSEHNSKHVISVVDLTDSYMVVAEFGDTTTMLKVDNSKVPVYKPKR